MKMHVHFEAENQHEAAFLAGQLHAALSGADMPAKPQSVTITADGPNTVEANAAALKTAETLGKRGRPKKQPEPAPSNETPPAAVLEPVQAEAPAEPAIVFEPEPRADGTAAPIRQTRPDSITIDCDGEVLTFDPPFTLDQVKDTVRKILAVPDLGVNAARGLFEKHGAGKASDVPATRYPEFLADAKALIEQAVGA